MDSAARQLGEFGVLASLLACVVVGAFWFARWVGVNAVVPTVQALVAFINTQSEVSKETLESIRELRTLELKIDAAIDEMAAAHSDVDSTFATVHTNEAIRLLAMAVQEVANGMDLDVSEIVDKIQTCLQRQDK